MDTIVRPERGAFVAIAPFIPPSLIDSAQMLVNSIRDAGAQRVMEHALQKQIEHLQG